MKKFKDTVAHGTRPKLIRQCRSFAAAAPALVVAAQFPKEGEPEQSLVFASSGIKQVQRVRTRAHCTKL